MSSCMHPITKRLRYKMMNMNNKLFSGKISSINQITEEVFEVKITLQRDLEFIPGQFIFILIGKKLGVEKRAFSIMDYEAKERNLILGIKLNGSFTRELVKRQIGTDVVVLGPYGQFVARKEEDNKIKSRQVFVAGGIGLTPIFNILKRDKIENAHMFMSSKTRNSLPFADRLESLNAEKHFFFTREGDERINLDVLRRELKDF